MTAIANYSLIIVEQLEQTKYDESKTENYKFYSTTALNSFAIVVGTFEACVGSL